VVYCCQANPNLTLVLLWTRNPVKEVLESQVSSRWLRAATSSLPAVRTVVVTAQLTHVLDDVGEILLNRLPEGDWVLAGPHPLDIRWFLQTRVVVSDVNIPRGKSVHDVHAGC